MVLAVIPSRYHSSRFPGKALVSIAGVPLLARVVRRVLEAGVADRVLVATDDQRIAAVAEAAGAEVRRSDAEFRSGSDRVAAAVAALDLAATDTVINVQGDEPLIDGRVLAGAVAALGWSDLGTVVVPTDDLEVLGSQDVVKVHVEAGRALSFARDAQDLPGTCQPMVHLGVYAFSAWSLRRFAELPSPEEERIASLEQLRALAHGMGIGVKILCAPHASVNRPEDIARLETLIQERSPTWQTSEPRSSS